MYISIVVGTKTSQKKSLQRKKLALCNFSSEVTSVLLLRGYIVLYVYFMFIYFTKKKKENKKTSGQVESVFSLQRFSTDFFV